MFELSMRGIDTSSLKYDNQSEEKRDPEQTKALDLALENAKERKARDYGRKINDTN